MAFFVSVDDRGAQPRHLRGDLAFAGPDASCEPYDAHCVFAGPCGFAFRFATGGVLRIA